MKFSEKWLREQVNPAVDTQAMVSQITMAGLEVDEVIPVAADFSQVVVGEILTAEAHPNADKLQVCSVSDGQDTYQVVCGAPNARAGLKTAFAQVGAQLPTPEGKTFTIKKAKLRQVESFGMLCAENELGISEDHSGIMELATDAPVGADLREYLLLDDQVIDVDLTPNRGDCLSIKGLAREVGVLNDCPVKAIAVTPVPPAHQEKFTVELEAPEACPRYLGRIIKGVDLSVETPVWMVEKLRRSGIRAIDPVVDVTNYVLLELGQPLHAFDLEKLQGGIRVRLAEAGEELTLLDGNTVTLTPDTLVIADHKGPIAMAGIFGGEKTGVTAASQTIFLESAYFDPIAIAGRARAYGLHTDASHRYERGVDWQLQKEGIERATQLLLEIAGGEAGPVIEALSTEHLPSLCEVILHHAKVNQMLAFDMPADEIEAILMRLGMGVTQQEKGCWKVAVPSYRFDISIEVDLIEELARVYGYNNLPVKLPNAALPFTPDDESKVSVKAIRHTLAALGYQEAVTYSFIEAGLQEQFDDVHQAIALANPISAEMAVMRTTIWPGLVKALQYNQNRQQSRVRLFETGQCFVPTKGELEQKEYVAGVMAGPRYPEGWSGKPESVDFYDIKGDLEQILDLGGAGYSFQFVPGQHKALHPGQCAAVQRGGEVMGYAGALHPSLVQSLGLSGPVYLFELALDKLLQGVLPRFSALSKFPESRRDLALVVDESVPYGALREKVLEQGGEFLQQVILFDQYQGQGVEAGRKSLALGLTWQHPSRTLTEDEISASVQNILTVLSRDFDAKLRE